MENMQTPMTGENSLRYWDTQSRKESTVKGVKENICIYRSDNLKGIKCWQLILVNCQIYSWYKYLPSSCECEHGCLKGIYEKPVLKNSYAFISYLCGSNVHSLYCIYSFYFCSFFFNVLHFSFYISFPGVFTLFLYFGTKIHTNNTLIL